jgi:hypothetical protein
MSSDTSFSHQLRWFIPQRKQPSYFEKVTLKGENMNEAGASIDFTGEEMEMILAYMDAAEAVTVQAAILNAISLALDHIDD